MIQIYSVYFHLLRFKKKNLALGVLMSPKNRNCNNECQERANQLRQEDDSLLPVSVYHKCSF